jgi:hypothetical protein
MQQTLKAFMLVAPLPTPYRSIMIPKISTACHHVIFLAMARKITSASSLFAAAAPPPISAPCRPRAWSFNHQQFKSGQLVC